MATNRPDPWVTCAHAMGIHKWATRLELKRLVLTWPHCEARSPKTMVYLLAIDPGAKTGYATFHLDVFQWRLASASVRAPTDSPPLTNPDIVVIENPQIYPHSKARPNDILKLARVVGMYEERFCASKVHLVTPHEWKGSVNGDIMCARIEASLSPYEKTLLDMCNKGVRHNAVDAVGIGKWAMKQPWIRAWTTVAAAR